MAGRIISFFVTLTNRVQFSVQSRHVQLFLCLSPPLPLPASLTKISPHFTVCLPIILWGPFLSPRLFPRGFWEKEKRKCQRRQRKQDSSEDIDNKSLSFSSLNRMFTSTPIIIIIMLITTIAVRQLPPSSKHPPLLFYTRCFAATAAASTQQGFNDFLLEEETVLRVSL